MSFPGFVLANTLENEDAPVTNSVNPLRKSKEQLAFLATQTFITFLNLILPLHSQLMAMPPTPVRNLQASDSTLLSIPCSLSMPFPWKLSKNLSPFTHLLIQSCCSSEMSVTPQSPSSSTFFSGLILRNLLSTVFYNVTTPSCFKLYDLTLG